MIFASADSMLTRAAPWRQVRFGSHPVDRNFRFGMLHDACGKSPCCFSTPPNPREPYCVLSDCPHCPRTSDSTLRRFLYAPAFPIPCRAGTKRPSCYPSLPLPVGTLSFCFAFTPSSCWHKYIFRNKSASWSKQLTFHTKRIGKKR